MTAATDKFAGIQDIVTSAEDMQSVLGEPMPQVLIKEIDHIDDICRDFIAKSPFCVIASANPGGHIDVSPKGDPVGFVRVLDEKHLAIPDRPGNRRADTFHNLLRDPRLGILFIIPGKTETLRVSGEACITRDESLRQLMPVNRKVPEPSSFMSSGSSCIVRNAWCGPRSGSPRNGPIPPRSRGSAKP